jgi:hypothetical protein
MPYEQGSYCAKVKIQCVYINPSQSSQHGRQPEIATSQPNAELLTRLQALEQTVQQLQGRLSEVEASHRSTDADRRTLSSSHTSPYLVVEPGELLFSAYNQTTPPTLRRSSSEVGHYDFLNQQMASAAFSRYVTDIDPLLKLVDIEYVESTLLTYPRASPDGRALVTAICYATEACRAQITIEEYRAVAGTTETSFKSNKLLTRPTVPKLQAFLIYLTCGRTHMDLDYLSMMLSILVQLAMRLQLDQDPAELGYLPAECEVRRRLWWHIISLDVRTAEARGTTPIIQQQESRIQIPSMVKDAQLGSAITLQPLRHATCTVFTVATIEMADLAKKNLFGGEANVNDTSRVTALNKSHQSLLDKHRDACKCVDSPICRLTAEWCKIYWTRQYLLLLYWDQRFLKQVALDITNELAETALTACVDILERVQGLRQNADYSRWAWLWQNCVEWDAAAVALTMIAGAYCSADSVSRAWTAIDNLFLVWKSPFGDPKHQKRWSELEVFRRWVRVSAP